MPLLHFKKRHICAALFALIGTPNFVAASPFGYGDISNAPSPYGQAWSSTGDFQRLGNTYGGADGANNDGVSWSIDNGNTYGHGDVTIGQTVKFKYELYSHNIGGHVFDPIRSWFDKDGNGSWSTSEMILSDQYNKAGDRDYWLKGTPDNPIPSGGNQWNTRDWENGNADDWIQTTFFSEFFLSDDTKVGDTWLRTRATCDASLGGSDFQDPNKNWTWQAVEGDINTMGPNGWLHQGETEDYKIRVLAKKVTVEVPEPSSIILLVFGAATLLLSRFRAGALNKQ